MVTNVSANIVVVANYDKKRIALPHHEERAPVQPDAELEESAKPPDSQPCVQMWLAENFRQLTSGVKYCGLIALREALHGTPKTRVAVNFHAIRLTFPALISFSKRFLVFR